MRLRWLLLAVVTMSLMPSLASARSRVRGFDHPAAIAAKYGDYSIGAAINEETLQLVLAFYNPGKYPIELPVKVLSEQIDYDWLTVEISNATSSQTIKFTHPREHAAVQTARIEPGGLHFETIDLGSSVHTLPAGTYDVRVTWDQQVTMTTLTSHHVPELRCGLTYESYRYTLPPKPAPSSKWPYVLGGLGVITLLSALLLQKRAGTAYGRVPCSAL